jgi:hypothetical protein
MEWGAKLQQRRHAEKYEYKQFKNGLRSQDRNCVINRIYV